MKTTRSLLLSLSLAGLSAACATPPKLAQGRVLCPIAVEFTSMCCGTHRPAMEAMEAVLASPAHQGAEWVVHPWGREGEQTWCVTPRSGDRTLLGDLRKIAAEAAPLPNLPAPQVQTNRVVEMAPGR